MLRPEATGIAGSGQPFHGTGRFQLARLLGRGGMGLVYEAHDRKSGVRVALKLLPTPSADLLFHFKNEFRSLADLRHPNLVRLGELFSDGAQWFFSMELVQGTDFLSWVRRVPGPTRSASSSISPVAGPSEPGAATVRVSGPPPEVGAVGPARADESRLRAGLTQLAQGLLALHGVGKVHRDVKPSNVLVTAEGRVVLLDFGLVGDVVADQTLVGLGTPAYMAPEQAGRTHVGPAADSYAVGVMLYEALAGRLPFEGLPHEILYTKQRSEPAPPRTINSAVPPDLDALCVDLLRIDPGARPSVEDILRRLDPSAPVPSGGRTEGSSLFGREEELQVLRSAFEDAKSGGCVAVLVRGESGVGKTALVRHFLKHAGPVAEALVLAARCFERESVPFKAFDGVIDALTHRLIRLRPDVVTELLPARADILPRLFPVLGRIEALGSASSPLEPELDPQELRSRAFATLRELFQRLSARWPLAILIDDLHWADADSLVLLRELLRPPGPSRLLLVATWADVPSAGAEVQAPELWASGTDGRIVLRVENLPGTDARAMAEKLLGRSAPGSEAAAIAEEAGGHPLFIQELVRHRLAHGRRDEALQLDEVLAHRIGGLDPAAQLLLEVVVTAGAPVPQDVLLDAAAIEPAAFADQLMELKAKNFVRTRGMLGRDAVETYHDRIRRAVRRRQSDHDRKQIQGRLARALEGRSDPATLAVHWREAGYADRAGKYASLAGEHAFRALAFSRASRHFKEALELGTWDGGERRRLRTRLGEALANAGQAAQAAAAFLEAAQGADPMLSSELRRRASEELLRSGHIDEGLAAIRSALVSAGMRVPPTSTRAVASLLYQRARLRLRGLGFREREAAAIAAESLAQIDLCWAMASGLGLADPIQAAHFQTRSLLLALQAGEPYRVARGLCGEAAFVATRGEPVAKRTSQLLALARGIAVRLGHPHALGLVDLMSGMASYMRGRFAEGRLTLESAERQFRDRCAGAVWELDATRQFWLECVANLGDMGVLARHVRQGIDEAADRGNLYAGTNLRTGLCNLVWLADDEPDQARAAADEAVARWSRTGFHLQHWYDLLAQVQIDLYRGDGRAAHTRFERSWVDLSRSHLLRIQNLRIAAIDLRGRAALAAAESGGGDHHGLVGAAARDGDHLRSERVPWATPLADLLEAGVATTRGRADRAVERLRAAAAGFDAVGMALHAAVARRRLGDLEGGEAGASLVAEADTCLAGRGVRSPARMAGMLAGYSGQR